MLRETIAEIYDNGISRALHKRVLATLAIRNLGEMDKEELFLAYRYLQDAIIADARGDGHQDKKNDCVQEEFYERETCQLLRIAKATQYSAELSRWANQRRKILMDAFQKASIPETIRDGLLISEAAMVNTLQRMTDMHLRVYANNIFSVSVPQIEPVTQLDGPVASVDAPSLDTIHDPADIPILISRSLLTRAAMATSAAILHHEGMHHLTLQLGIALLNGELKDDHPLHADAALSLARLKAEGTASGHIKSVYDGDGEERFAYFQQALFRRALAKRMADEMPAPVNGTAPALVAA
ncbi:MAG: hypothetical protein EOM26_09870 [Alphaproteobacteria bacterium]|nr:hypothetical protein [Alphaproteobacteria bacterium]